MGLFDDLQPIESSEDEFDDELTVLKARESRILSQIGEKFVYENRNKDMTRTQYGELFKQLSEVEKELDRVLDDVNVPVPIDKIFETKEDIIEYEEPTSKNRLMSRLVISGTVLFVIAALGIGFALLNRKPKVDLGTATEVQQETQVADAEETENNVTVSQEELMSQFGLFKSNRADYSNSQVLDYTKYRKYESEIENFSFYYPSDIFNDVRVVNNKEGVEYGKVLRQITLSGTDGSTTEVAVFKNNLVSQTDMESINDYVVKTERESLFTPLVRLNQVSKTTDQGTVVLTAYTDGGANSDCALVMCHTDAQRIYRMKITYPRPRDEEEDKQKAYYAHIMPILCGFGTGERNDPDSYEDFVTQEYTKFQLKQWQKDIFWGIMDNMVTSRELYDQYEKEYVVPTGTREELEKTLSDDSLLLQMYLHASINKDSENIQSERFACMVDGADSVSKLYYKSEIDKEDFEQFYNTATGEKDVLKGSLDYARTFFRDMFSLELDVKNLIQDNPGVYPGETSLLLYSEEYDDLVYASSYTNKNRVEGPDDWDYNEELDCFDYHMGPVYELNSGDLNWQQKRDEKDPGNGIYIAHIRPFRNNSVGFLLLGIERDE